MGTCRLDTREASEVTRAVVSIKSLRKTAGTDGLGVGDWALLKLGRPVSFGRGRRPICLPRACPSGTGFPGPLKLIAAGWGATYSGSTAVQSSPKFPPDEEMRQGVVL